MNTMNAGDPCWVHVWHETWTPGILVEVSSTVESFKYLVRLDQEVDAWWYSREMVRSATEHARALLTA